MRTRSVETGVPDKAINLMAVIWPLTALAFITASFRIVIRARCKMFGWDDIFMILSMHGGVTHIWDLQKTGPNNVAYVLLLNWSSQVFGIIGVAAGKVSVSALLLAIIKMSDMRWQRIYLLSIIVVLASLVAISCSMLTFSQCSPAKALWDTRVNGTCIDPHVMASYGIFTGSFNTFADASLAVIPATIFWQLNGSATEKVQLTIVFGLNILTSICSGIKTQYLAELSNRTDQTWATYDIFVWVTAELFLMIVCGTIPTLHPLLRFIRRAIGIARSSLSRSHKIETKVEEEAELSVLSYRTQVKESPREERGYMPHSESSDQLVDGGIAPSQEVHIGLRYDASNRR
ncbi:hypothetical protein G7046_g2513 [Stylonectria norvegica]|nr:hypothetical protein G7046_g2513 [Stylonectria norvegica]